MLHLHNLLLRAMFIDDFLNLVLVQGYLQVPFEIFLFQEVFEQAYLGYFSKIPFNKQAIAHIVYLTMSASTPTP